MFDGQTTLQSLIGLTQAPGVPARPGLATARISNTQGSRGRGIGSALGVQFHPLALDRSRVVPHGGSSNRRMSSMSTGTSLSRGATSGTSRTSGMSHDLTQSRVTTGLSSDKGDGSLMSGVSGGPGSSISATDRLRPRRSTRMSNLSNRVLIHEGLTSVIETQAMTDAHLDSRLVSGGPRASGLMHVGGYTGGASYPRTSERKHSTRSNPSTVGTDPGAKTWRAPPEANAQSGGVTRKKNMMFPPELVHRDSPPASAEDPHVRIGTASPPPLPRPLSPPPPPPSRKKNAVFPEESGGNLRAPAPEQNSKKRMPIFLSCFCGGGGGGVS